MFPDDLTPFKRDCGVVALRRGDPPRGPSPRSALPNGFLLCVCSLVPRPASYSSALYALTITRSRSRSCKLSSRRKLCCSPSSTPRRWKNSAETSAQHAMSWSLLMRWTLKSGSASMRMCSTTLALNVVAWVPSRNSIPVPTAPWLCRSACIALCSFPV